MTSLDEQISAATRFIVGVDLPLISSSRRGGGGLSDVLKPINSEQSLAVGRGVVSFLPQTPSKSREAVTNSFLLAQLAADKRTSASQNMDEWYLTFFEALTHTGWLVLQRKFDEYTEHGSDVETHEAILGIAGTLLGSGTAAYLLVKSTLDALLKLTQDDWIDVFRRDEKIRTGQLFQIAVAEPLEQGGVTIDLMAFQISARSTRTDILFFKWGSAEATLRHTEGKVEYSASIAERVGDQIARKVKSYTADYVTNLEI
jgi:hypothetical protein